MSDYTNNHQHRPLAARSLHSQRAEQRKEFPQVNPVNRPVVGVHCRAIHKKPQSASPPESEVYSLLAGANLTSTKWNKSMKWSLGGGSVCFPQAQSKVSVPQPFRLIGRH